MPRFPVRIELSRFAAILAKHEVSSLFGWLLALVRRGTDRDLCADDLRAWLQAWPWLLVLDGLDEVPATSNRREVLDAVQNFLIDANDCKADLLLVATSRPQGYNDDFSPRFYRHRVLLPLAVSRALEYAQRLAEQRWGADQDKVTRIRERMAQAGREPATALLMQSPLQVTIMTLLVERVGQPPRERWRLFDEYYRIIVQRERERAIPAASGTLRPRAGWPWHHWPIAALAQEPQAEKGRAESPAELAAQTLRGRRASRRVRGWCQGTRREGQ